MSRIKDVIHGYIPLNDLEAAIIDTPQYQRLKGIHQLGTAYSVYHSCRHTRFEHSLAVMHLGSKIFNKLLEEKKFLINKDVAILKSYYQTFRLACLMHDIGQPPFSHICESLFDESNLIGLLKKGIKSIKLEKGEKQNHEIMSCIISLKILKNLSKNAKLRNEISLLDKNLFCRIILGKLHDSKLNSLKLQNIIINILSSNFDCDKIDYFLRDNYYSGLSIVSFDVSRFIDSYTINKEKTLVIGEKSLSSIQNFVLARELLYSWIYRHPVVIYTDNMMFKIVKYYWKKLTFEDLFDRFMDENYILGELKKHCFKHNFKDPKKIEALRLYKTNFINRNYLKPLFKTHIHFQLFFRRIVDKYFEGGKNKLNYSIYKDAIEGYLPDEAIKYQAELIKELKINEKQIFVYYYKSTPYKFRASEIPINIEEENILYSEVFTYKVYTEDFYLPNKIPFIYCEEKYKSLILKYIEKKFEEYLIRSDIKKK